MSDADKAAMWLMQLLLEVIQVLDLPPLRMPLPHDVDNMGGVKYASRPQLHSRLKHVNIKEAHVRDLSEKGIIEVNHTPTHKQRANGLTKLVTGAQHKLTLEQLQIADLDELM